MPPLVTKGLWPAQERAIRNLEASLAADRPRALIQMATGSGKTLTAISSIYRLTKSADARRVLFLVDRGNLGRQTMKVFQQCTTPDDGRKFTELYNVQHLKSNRLDPVSCVCIKTIQRLYSVLRGDADLDPTLEEGSQFDTGAGLISEPAPVSYNPLIPIKSFDVIFTDECHRSIYNLWRQVLDYFDAHLIALTATPSKQTFKFFNQNPVMEYNHQRAMAEPQEHRVVPARRSLSKLVGVGKRLWSFYSWVSHQIASRRLAWLVTEYSEYSRLSAPSQAFFEALTHATPLRSPTPA